MLVHREAGSPARPGFCETVPAFCEPVPCEPVPGFSEPVPGGDKSGSDVHLFSEMGYFRADRTVEEEIATWTS
jgi:hypothetical protein